MKKIITLLTIALFTINVGAQQTKPLAKEGAKTEEMSKCKMKDAKKCSKEDMAKCKMKDPKKCNSEEMSKSKASGKKCCAKKE